MHRSGDTRLALRKESINLSSALAPVSRRRFLQNCALAALAPVSVLRGVDAHHRGPAQSVYSLDKDWARAAKMTSARVYIRAQNLFTWTPYKGYDPETPVTTYNVPGYSAGNYANLPPMKMLTAGLQCTF